MGRLTTHVLDTAAGRPAGGVQIELFALRADGMRLIRTVTTNPDGRTDEPLLAGEEFAAGKYQLLFHVAPYFGNTGRARADPPFLDEVPVRFAVADADGHYHVPLLISPWSYTTYRGS